MITKIQFQKGASVLTTDGVQIGTVERVVVNASTNVLTDIVVRKGGLLKSEEKVVPVKMIAETTDEHVLLLEEAGDLESLPPFEEERFVGSHAGSTHSGSESGQPPAIIGFPSVGGPIMQASIPEEPITRLEQNIPEGSVAVKEGAKVITSEGKYVGNVERVFADPSADEVTHLLISRGLLTKETKLIPMKWVSTLGEEKIHLRVKKNEVEKLANASSLAG